MTLIIYVIGPDGVGKTTQAHFIEKTLSSAGLPVKYVWMRWNHKFSLPLLLLARFLKLTKNFKLSNGKTIGYHYFDKIKPIAVLYQYTYLIDTLIAFYAKIKFEAWKGKIVICDRSPYDAIVDLTISIRDKRLLNKHLMNVFYFMTKNAVVIMLIASSTTLKARREDVFYDNAIFEKVNLYHELAALRHFHEIDSEKEINVVKTEIQQIIEHLIYDGIKTQ